MSGNLGALKSDSADFILFLSFSMNPSYSTKIMLILLGCRSRTALSNIIHLMIFSYLLSEVIYDKYGTIVIGMIFDKKSCIQERWWLEIDFFVFILKQSTLFIYELEFT